MEFLGIWWFVMLIFFVVVCGIDEEVVKKMELMFLNYVFCNDESWIDLYNFM